MVPLYSVAELPRRAAKRAGRDSHPTERGLPLGPTQPDPSLLGVAISNPSSVSADHRLGTLGIAVGPSPGDNTIQVPELWPIQPADSNRLTHDLSPGLLLIIDSFHLPKPLTNFPRFTDAILHCRDTDSESLRALALGQTL